MYLVEADIFYYYFKALSCRKVTRLLASLSFVIVTICPSPWRSILQATHSVQQIAECHAKDFMTRLSDKYISIANTCCYCLQQGCHLLTHEWANMYVCTYVMCHVSCAWKLNPTSMYTYTHIYTLLKRIYTLKLKKQIFVNA